MRRTIAAVLLGVLLTSALAGCTSAETQVVTLRPTEKPAATQRPQTDFEVSEAPMETESLAEEKPEQEKEMALEATPEPKEEAATEAPSATPEPTPVPEVSSASHFYLKQESDKVRKAFDVIYAGVLAHKKSIELPENVDEDTLNKVQWLLRYDCPELFWLSQLTSFVYVNKE